MCYSFTKLLVVYIHMGELQQGEHYFLEMAKYCQIYRSVVNHGGGLERQIQHERFSVISGYCLQLTRVLSVGGEGQTVWRADGPGKRGALCLCVVDVQGDI